MKENYMLPLKSKRILFLVTFFLCLSSFAQETYIDRFNTVSYNNNDGTQSFYSDWEEASDPYWPREEPENSGKIQVLSDGRLRFQDLDYAELSRSLNLSGVSDTDVVTLSFDYDARSRGNESLSVVMYNNLTGSYDVITTINSSVNSSFSIVLASQYIFNNSIVGFISGSGNWNDDEIIYIDNVTFTITNTCTDTSGVDTDGDGVNDICDLDDDNDGILDINELGVCTTNNSTLNWDNEYVEGGGSNTDGEDPVVTNPNLVIDGTPIKLSRDGGGLSTQQYRVNDFYTTASSYTLYQKAQNNGASRHVFEFGEPVYNLGFTIYDVDRGSSNSSFIDELELIVTKADGTLHTLSSSEYTLNNQTVSGNSFIGTAASSDRDVVINGIEAWVTKVEIVYKNLTTSPRSTQYQGTAIGNMTFCNTQLDSDNDGTPDYLDTDSDNDGCPDALEGNNTNLTLSDINGEGRLTSGVNSTTGVPTIVGTGQTDVSSTNASVTGGQCDDDDDGVPNVSDKCDGFDDNIDTDGDGVPNGCDLDDDNDGILDTEENNCTGTISYEFYNSYPLSHTVDDIPTTGALATGTSTNFNVDQLWALHTPGDHETFSVRYKGLLRIDTDGAYTFYTTSDDGSKLFINGIEVVDNDGSHPSRTRNGQITLKSGVHELEVLFYERTGEESLSVEYEGPSISRRNLPFSRLSCLLDSDNDGTPNYLDTDSDNDGCFDALEGNNTNLTLSDINGEGRLTSGVNSTTGVPTIVGTGQTDVSSTNASVTGGQCDDDDDGVPNVSDKCNGFDDNIDTDGDGVPNGCDLDDDNDGILDTEENNCTGTISYEFYDSYPLSDTVDDIPTTGALATGTRTNFNVDQLWALHTPGDDETFSVRYKGLLRIDTDGAYTFYTTSDDGSKLFINGIEVVDNDGPHGSQTRSGQITLKSGVHELEVLFYERTGAENLFVEYEGPSISRRNLPFSRLSCLLDSDNDGIPNHLDLDSDNDGCPDAIEASENVSSGQLDGNGRIDIAAQGSIDSNGVPNLVNDSGAADIGDDQGQETTGNEIVATQIQMDTQPSDSTICLGSNVTFTAAASSLSTTTYTGSAPSTTPDYSGSTSTTTGLVYQWQEQIAGAGAWNNISNGGIYSNATTPALTLTNPPITVSTNKYRLIVTSTLNTCQSLTSNEVSLTIDLTSVGGSIAGSTNVCTGTNSTTLTLSGYTGNIIRWESSTDNFATDTDIANTTTTLTATNLTTTTQYRAVVQSGACAEATSATATITVGGVVNLTIGNITADNIVNASEAGSTIPVTGTVGGDFNTGDTVTLVINGNTYTGTVDASGNYSINVPGSELASDGDTTVDGSFLSATSCSTTTSHVYIVDITAPTVPTVNSQVTNDTTPVITGTADSSDTIEVTVNGETYTEGDGNLVDNGDGTWTLNIPAGNEIAEGTYDVSVTATDAAGNTSSDATTDELVIDTTAPTVPTVNSQVTNDTTPVITGTADSSDTIEVTVNGETYTEGDGNLVDNGDGTWTLNIPAGNEIAEGTYDVSVTATDAAGNTSSDATTDELVIDTTAPTVPTVNSQVTNDTTPVITGTADSSDTIEVTVNGETYTEGDGNLVDNGDGTWTLNIPAGNEIAEGTYDVSVTATDAAGNTSSDATTDELVIDTTAPTVPTVNSQVTNDTTPVITGTADSSDTIEVTVNGETYTEGDGNLVDNGDGTWTLNIPAGNEIAEGTYDVSVTATDAAGNTSSDATTDELVIDTTAPTVPTVNSQVTNDTTPVITGTADSSDTIEVTVNGETYTEGDGNLVDNGDGTWTLNIPAGNEIAEGTYDVSVTATDAAGNTSSDATTDELVIDTTAPTVPTVNSQVTNDTTPVITGTADSSDTIEVTVNGETYTEGDGNLVDNGDGTWTLNIPAGNEIAEGTYDVSVTATDAAGNTSSDATTDELVIDTTAPTVPTVNSQVTNDTTPVITGTADSSDTIEVTVNGETYTEGDGNLVDNGDGTWTLNIPAGNEIAEGTYDVSVTATDAAGNTSSDATTDELVIDTTAPTVPTVNSQVTNDTTPVITGTADSSDTIEVTVNGETYTEGDGNLVDNGDGTWTLNIPAGNEIAEGTYDVSVTATDAAGNTSSDATTDELVIDTTAPTVPTVNSQVTNDTTPVITGTADSSDTIEVTVNGETYTEGDGNLVDNGDGTWTLNIPAGNEIAEGTYDVSVEATDAGGNTSSDATTDELVIDTTAPTVPTVNSQVTNDTTPVITGTADSSDTIEVTVNGETYTEGDGNLVDNGDGTWTLNIPAGNEIAEGTYDVSVEATDAGGNTSSDATTDELVIDTTAPTVPTVNSQVTNDTTPVITGTADSSDTIEVTVNGETYTEGDGNLVDNGDGTWTLNIPAGNEIAEGTYDVSVTATDAAGNTSSDATTDELVIDTTAPTVPTVNSQVTNDTTPVITGTADSSDTIEVTVNGETYTEGDGNLVDNGDGTWTLNIPAGNEIAEGTYDVSVTATDAAGNTSSDATTDELVIDTTAPTVPTVNSQVTNDTTPVITGTADSSDTIEVTVNGETYTEGDGNLVDNGDGTWTLNIPAGNEIAEGTYDVSVEATDAGGNTSSDATTDELVIDTTAPTVPTVNSQVTNDTTPVITGTADSSDTIEVTVNGETYTEGDGNLVDNGDGTWTLNIPAGNEIAEGTYDVSVEATDAGGNTSSDATTDELVIDTTAPTVPTVNSQVTNDTTPVITGTADSSDTIEVTVNGETYTEGDGNLVDNGDGTWTLNIPAGNEIAEGTYDVSVEATDAGGNTSSDATTDELVIDTTAPTVPTVNSQVTNDTTPVITGTADSSDTIEVTVNGETYTEGDGNLVDNGDGTWTLNIPAGNEIAEGTYDVSVTATDAAGNTSSDATTDELVIDTTAPTVPTVNSQVTNDTTPVITGTADSSDTIEVTVNGETYTEGDGNLVDNGDGTWTLNIPAGNEIAEGTYDVSVTATDAAGNTSSDATTDELVIDTTAPTVPTVNSQVTNDTTPVITGTADSSDTIEVTVNGETYTEGDGNLVDNGDGTWTLNIPAGNEIAEGTYDVSVEATDAGGNTSSDATTDELVIDTTAPTVPTVNSQVTNDTTPVITGTADSSDTIEVTVNGETYTEGDGNLVDNGDGTWTLNIPAGNEIAEGTYDVSVTATDAGGNTSSDATTDELVIDTTAPTVPTVNSQVTNDTTPVITGTADSSDTIEVTVNGETYTEGDGNLVDNGDGTWTLNIPAGNEIAEGTYDVSVEATDAGGNTSSDATTDELVIDTTAPTVPTVNSQVTNDTTPVITGTADSSDTIEVTVNGETYTEGDGNLVDNGDGTWTLNIPAGNEIAEGTYDVSVTATDAAGNTSSDATTDELVIDTTAPTVPTVNSQVTNDTTPVITGTADSSDTIEVTVNGETYTEGDGNLVDNGDGTWTLNIPAGNEIAEGTYDVSVTATDAAGNTSSDATTDELVIDTTAPTVPTVNSQVTNDTTPVITGTADSSDTIEVTVNGETYTEGDGNLVDNGDGTWTLNIPAGNEIAEGTYDVSVEATDAAGNTSSDATTDELVIDTTAPTVPTVNSQVTNDTTPVITGTADSSDTIEVTVNGETYTEGDGNLVDNGDGTWTLNIPAGNEIAEGTYDVSVTATDAAGNTSSDATTDELVIDTTAPTVPTVNSQVTNDTTPVITGTADSSDTIEVTVNGETYTEGDGNLVDNGDGTWTLNIPAGNEIAEGTYDVSVEATDAAGNTSSDVTTDELVIDTTAPTVPTVNSQVTNDTTPVITGTADSSDTIEVTVNGETYTEGDGNLVDNGDGTWTLNIPAGNEIAEGTYDVSVTATDAAGNTSSDATTDELVIDTTAPTVPTVNSQVTNDTTPVITGTADSSDTIEVTVNGETYTEGDGNLVDNGDGTWTLNIPAGNEIAEGTYDVSVTATDAAGNTSSDATTDELVIDTTAPTVPTVNSQVTNDTTPVITGTADSSDTIEVTVNGETYTEGDGNLVDNGDGTWTLNIPAGNEIAEGTYDVSVEATDAGGNTSSDVTTDELVIDTTAPTVPTVNSQVTNDTTPVITGTADSSDTIEVTVNGETYTEGDGNLVDNGDGTWTLNIPAGNEIAEGTYDVSVTATDAAGNTSSDATTDELVIDTTAPTVPTVNSQVTNDTTPVITGTADSSDTIEVTVNGETYTEGDGNLVDNGDGTWTLNIPAGNEIAEGTYDVSVTATDAGGNTSSDVTTDELVIDTTAPTVPTVNSQVTNDTTPVITGTADSSDTIEVTVNGETYTEGDGNLVDNGDGTWTLNIPAGNEIAEGTYNVSVEATDAAGNTSSDATTDELVIDTTAPTVPTVNSQVTNDTTPVITGTADSSDTIEVTVNGETYTEGDGNLVDNGDGTWTLNIPAGNEIAEGTYDVSVTATDAGGNTSSDATTDELVIDTTAPTVPTVNSQVTNDTTPVITGTADSSDTIEVTVNGETYTEGDGNLVDNGDGTWTLNIPAGNEIAEGTYDVSVEATDAAGNTSSDVTTDELVIDTTAPTVPTVNSQVTNDTTPVITGTADSSDTIEVTVNGETYTEGDGNLVDNGDGTWTLNIPAGNEIAEGTYNVSVEATDAAGNTSSDATTDELVIDTTAPTVPTVNSQVTNDTTPVITGTADSSDTIEVTVNGETYTEGDGNLVDNGDGTWTLNIPAGNEIAEGTYDVSVTATDAGGNTSSDVTTDELVIDTTAPTVPTVNSQVTNDTTPVITGTADSSDTIEVTVNGETYTEGDGNLVDNGDGTWTLNIPAGNEIAEGTYDVSVTATDAAGNTSSDATTDELVIDTTAPTVPTVNSQVTNDTTPVITGTADSSDTIEVTVNGETYTEGDGNLVDNGDGTWTLNIPAGNEIAEGTYDVSVTATDAAGNTSSDATTDELVIDTTAPTVPTVNSQVTNDTTPVITGTADSSDTIEVTVNGETYTEGDGNLVDNGDGTWTLNIPAGNEIAEGTYDVSVEATDAGGNTSSDVTTDELVIDTTAPTVPTVNSQVTNDTTPVITGTADSSDTIEVTVNGETYTEGDGNLVDNGDGTWTLNIPAGNEIAEGTYDVSVTATDAAGNTSSDATTDELVIDTTAPTVPTVNSQVTNDTTPVITGTADSSDTIEVTVNGETYTEGDGNLVDNGDGTWTLNIPAGNEIAEGTYDVSVEATDAGGNTSSDATTDELVIDTTAPTVPTVNSQVTNDTTPVITGTADSSDTIEVTVNGETYTEGDGNLVDNGDGTWTLNIPAGNEIAEGTYDVSVTATDAAGNTSSDATTDELVIDTTAPTVPTVNSQVTNDTTPVITGTADSSDTIEVTVNGETYTEGDGNLVDNGDGTWTLNIPAGNEIAEGTYDVSVTATDAAGNTSSDATTDELVIDTTAPTVPTVNSQVTNDTTPVITGTADSSDTIEVTVNGETYTEGDGNLVDNGDGTWTLNIPAGNEIAEGTYDVSVTATDAGGNTSSDVTTDELVIDTTAPTVPTVNSQVTNDTTPVITGTADSSDTIEVTVNGETYTEGDGNLVDNGDGTWTLNIPAGNEIAEGTYDVSVTATDAGGNTSSDVTTDELVIDTTAPTVPTVNSQVTNDTTPVITGTADSSDTIEVTVNGETYTEGDGNLVDNGDGTWTLNIPAGNEIAEGTYDVSVEATDAAGNTSSDATTDELVIDTTAPTVPTVNSQVTNDTTPVITGTADSSDTIEVTVNGETYTEGDGNLVDNGDGTWTLNIPAGNEIAEGTYDVSVTATDAAGNTSSDATTDELVIDTTAPTVPTVNSQVTNDTTPVITGTADSSDTIEVTVNGETYTEGDGNLVDNGDGTWTLNIPAGNEIAEGTYDVSVEATDAGGNTSSDATTDELVIDTTAPTVPTVNSQVTNDTTPVITGTADSSDTIEVTVNGETYTEGDGNLVDNGDGTWTLNIPAGNEIAEGTYDVSVTATDAAGNTSSDATTDELVIDTTAPTVPTVNSQVTNDTTPVITGTADSSDTIEVTVNGETYTEGDGNLVDNGDGTWTLNIPAGNEIAEGTYDVSVTATDAAGNTSSDATTDELVIDTTAPTVPTVNSQVTNDTTPVITGTADSSDTIEVTVNGETYTEGDGNLVDNGDGTWTLNIPAGNEIAEGTYDVSVEATDAGGNTSSDVTTDELVIDTTAPTVPTVNSQVTNDTTPVITGTADSSDTIEVTVNGETYTEGDGNLVDNGDGTWTLNIPAGNEIAEGTYDVSVTATDAAGNTSSDATTDELVIDTTAPTVPTVNSQVTNDTTPVITGTADSSDTIEVTVNGETYTEGDGNLVDNGDGTWTLNIPAGNEIAEGTYDVSVTATDAGGNTSSDVTTDELVIDTTAPVLTITIDYITADNVLNAAEAGITIAVTGTVGGDFNTGDTVTLEINGNTYTGTVDAAGDYSIDVPGSDLAADADTTVEASVISIDNHGNRGSASNTRKYYLQDTDNDGISDVVDVDDDNDGIPDVDEGDGSVDTDGDGIPDSLDLDSDNDGINDVIEGGNGDLDTNGDGYIDAQDSGYSDTNGDGQADASVDNNEEPDTDGDGVPDYQDLDSDNDGINDVIEGGNEEFDTNGDGVINTEDTGGLDSDGDGISDSVDGDTTRFGEGNGGDEGTIDSDGDTIPDYQDLDSDNDGVNDVVEGGNPDTDGDGQVDNPHDDSDNDGIADSVDDLDGFGDADNPDYNSNPTDPNDGGNGVVDGDDSDGDGIPDPVDGLEGFGDAINEDTCVKVNNLMSPNGDAANSYLHIDCIENFPRNTIEIFNRWGNTVYKAQGYNNSNVVFRGISEGRVNINVNDKLPVGTYFYILDLGNGSKVKKGWIYINR